jgi:hypothetical protein
MIGNLTFWTMTKALAAFSVRPSFQPTNETINLTPGTKVKLDLPAKIKVFLSLQDGEDYVYIARNEGSQECTAQLPFGLSLSGIRGIVSGSAEGNTSNQCTYVFSVQHIFSLEAVKVATITFNLRVPPPVATPNDNQAATSSASTSGNVSAIAGGVGGGAAFALLVACVLGLLLIRSRNNAKAKPYNFDDMIAALSDVYVEGGTRAPHEIKRHCVKLLDTLGKGNFGEVCKGLLSEIPGTPGYLVAVKKLLASADVDRSAILQEAALMAQFDNPVCIAVFYLGDQGI